MYDNVYVFDQIEWLYGGTGGLRGIGSMLEERAVMKVETSDALYGLAPYVISMFIVDLVSAV